MLRQEGFHDIVSAKGGLDMEQIIDYLDIPEEKRMGVLKALQNLDFWAKDGIEELKTRMDASVRDQLPIYRFVFRGDTLIGYSFLYGETAPNMIGGGGQSNVDQLPLRIAVRILEEDIAILEKHDCAQLAKVLRMLLENQKKGIGRRAEKDCR